MPGQESYRYKVVGRDLVCVLLQTHQLYGTIFKGIVRIVQFAIFSIEPKVVSGCGNELVIVKTVRVIRRNI